MVKPVLKRKQLSPTDASHRFAAYVYGNLLLLSAILLLPPKYFVELDAFTAIIGTSVATYVAHCIAEVAGATLHKTDTKLSEKFTHALRNALPIISTAGFPLLFALLGVLEVITGEWAAKLAVGTVVARILFTGVVISHYREEKVTYKSFIVGIVLAVVAITISVFKFIFTH